MKYFDIFNLKVSIKKLSLGSVTFAASLYAFAQQAQAQEVVENPYGLGALWSQGDWVAKLTLLILLIMSLVSWYVIISKLVEQSRLRKAIHQAQLALSNTDHPKNAADRLSKDSLMRHMVVAAHDTARSYDVVAEQVDANTWLAQGIEQSVVGVQSRVQNGLAILATIGSTAPFVGLFGTVWGIYHALVRIGISGQASIDRVAGPVGEALIMTAIGLAVAVPAVLGYNWLARRNKIILDMMRTFGSNLHTAYMIVLSRGRRDTKTQVVQTPKAL